MSQHSLVHNLRKDHAAIEYASFLVLDYCCYERDKLRSTDSCLDLFHFLGFPSQPYSCVGDLLIVCFSL